MDILKKLFSRAPKRPEKRYYVFSVKCLRCGESVTARVDLDNDLSVEYEPNGDVYYARKIIIGENRCFQRIEAQFKFNQNRESIEKQIAGGMFE